MMTTVQSAAPIIPANAIEVLSETSIGQGGFSDVFVASYTDPRTQVPVKVAVKVLRCNLNNPEEVASLKRNLHRDTQIWHRLNHENVLPFVGFNEELSPWKQPVLVSDFCENGDLQQCLRKGVFGVDKASIIYQVARGLEYLHSEGVVHGDIKPSNVLFGSGSRVLICDFGCSRLHEQPGCTRTALAATPGYQAPELFGINEGPNFRPKPEKESDVYAFGMLVLETLTGNAPFSHIGNQLALIHAIQKGVEPKHRYNGVTYRATWNAVDPCISVEPSGRPTMLKVVHDLAQNHG